MELQRFRFELDYPGLSAMHTQGFSRITHSYQKIVPLRIAIIDDLGGNLGSVYKVRPTDPMLNGQHSNFKCLRELSSLMT